VALIAFSLDTITNIMASVEDIANIANKLIDFIISIARIGLGQLARMFPNSLLTKINRVIAP
jgi:hypothetical protein